MTMFEHLDELRARIVWAAVAFLIGTVATFPFVQPIIEYTERGVTRYGIQIIQGGPMAPLVETVRMAAIGGLFLSGPVIIYQIVSFILPALTANERRLLISYLPVSMGLFACGIAFGFFVFEPIALRISVSFMHLITPVYLFDRWIDFVIGYTLPFGLLYEMPVVLVLLVKLGIVAPKTLEAGRRWAILGSVVIAVMFAPAGDPIATPTLIAAPLYLLYEAGILVARISNKKSKNPS